MCVCVCVHVSAVCDAIVACGFVCWLSLLLCVCGECAFGCGCVVCACWCVCVCESVVLLLCAFVCVLL